MYNKILFKFLFTTLSLFFYLFTYADDFEIITTKDGRTYFNVEVLKRTPTSLGIAYSKTMNSENRTVTTVPFSKMEEVYQKKYGYKGGVETEPATKAERIVEKPKQLKTVDSAKTETLKDKIRKYGKPVILRNGNIYSLDGETIQRINDSYKNTVYLGYKNYFLDGEEIYMANSPIDAKKYLKRLNNEIEKLKKELSPVSSKVEKVENDLRELKDKLTKLQISQATKTYKSSSGTTTVVYDQTNVKNCQKDIKRNEAKLEALNEQYGSIISSLSKAIADKQTQYDTYSVSLAKFEEPGSKVGFDSYFGSVVIVSVNRSFGSGFFVTDDGYIITNEHVITGQSKATIETHSKQKFIADVVKVDAKRDLALLKISGSGFPAMKVEDSANVKTGDDVITIGAPIGLDWSVTKGIISNFGIDPKSGTPQVQTDAAINHGNSGGPLINIKTGKVVGVNVSFIGKDSMTGDRVEGVNFAIASSEIYKAFPQLAKH